MRFFSPVLQSLANRANALVAQAEAGHPGMREVAAMVYVGDVYALREQGKATKSGVHGGHTDRPAPDRS